MKPSLSALLPHRTWAFAWLCAALLFTLTEPSQVEAAEPSTQAGIKPLSPTLQKLFIDTPSDRPAKRLDGVTRAQRGRHYVTSNEWNLHLLRPALEGLGGAYAGVGSDQAYVLIGFMRPEIAWLTDYDELVVAIHQIYHVFFKHADTLEHFLKLWRNDHKKEALNALSEAFPDTKQYHRVYKDHRFTIARRLKRAQKRFKKVEAKTWLTDVDDFNYVRDLVRAGRVRPLVANLLDSTAFRELGKAAKAMKIPIRGLYLSNAEQYWDYTPEYRANIGALHVDERSLIIRTLLTWERNKDYRYNVQGVANYLGYLGHERVRSVKSFIAPRQDKNREPEFFTFDEDVASWSARRAKRRKRMKR